jgi:hypothetical protein
MLRLRFEPGTTLTQTCVVGCALWAVSHVAAELRTKVSALCSHLKHYALQPHNAHETHKYRTNFRYIHKP